MNTILMPCGGDCDKSHPGSALYWCDLCEAWLCRKCCEALHPFNEEPGETLDQCLAMLRPSTDL